MRIGQLLKTLVEWIKRLLWSYRGKVPKPFVSIREKQYPLGLLKLVEGRDTLRAIRTWIICPKDYDSGEKRKASSSSMDIHIYLDFIGAIDGSVRSRTISQDWSATTTHTITILKASRRLNYEGTYDYEHLFSGHFDFQGQMVTAAEVQARIACDRLAILRGMRYISDLTWADEVEEVYRQIMGLDGIPSTEAFKFWRLEQSKRKPASRSRSTARPLSRRK